LEYLRLSKGRNTTLPETIRVLIFNAYQKYEHLKRERNEYDVEDIVRWIFVALRDGKEEYKGVTFTGVSIDEVQDLSPSQLSLFKFVVSNFTNFLFAGDTAQTVRLSFLSFHFFHFTPILTYYSKTFCLSYLTLSAIFAS
jgi:superfamily I DNA/RNA helicase